MLELLLDLLWWIWWGPVETGRWVIRLATFGKVHAEEEMLCGVVGLLTMAAVSFGVFFFFK
jgi:hypothetical protein